jgi:putative transposase
MKYAVFSRPKLEEKLNYIPLNPVRAKLVQQTTEWLWSSARWYEQQRSVGVPISWIE